MLNSPTTKRCMYSVQCDKICSFQSTFTSDLQKCADIHENVFATCHIETAHLVVFLNPKKHCENHADACKLFLFFRDTMNSQRYHHMLEDSIVPEINHMNNNHMIFMQDGPHPHYVNIIWNLRNTTLPWRWIEHPGSLHVISMGFGKRSGLQTRATNNKWTWKSETWCNIKCPSRIFNENFLQKRYKIP